MSCVVFFCSCQKEDEILDNDYLGPASYGKTDVSFVIWNSDGMNLLSNKTKNFIDISKSVLYEIVDGNKKLHENSFSLKNGVYTPYVSVRLFDGKTESSELEYLIQWDEKRADAIRCKISHVNTGFVYGPAITEVYVNGSLKWAGYGNYIGNEPIWLNH